MRTPEPNPSPESDNTQHKRQLLSLEEYLIRKWRFTALIRRNAAIARDRAMRDAKVKYREALAKQREFERMFRANVRQILDNDS